MSFSRLPVSALAAASLLLAGPLPAAAQAGLGAVVCVGSELQTLDSSSPVRRVVREDVAVVYRVGVRLDNREAVERALLSELGEHAEGSCAWSSPGDSHVAIVRYTGAIRLDLTLDTEDPRFQAFAVGYGASAAAAETNATTADARFATNYDGSGYEVLVQETWGVRDAGVAAGGAPRAGPGAASSPGASPGVAELSPGDRFSDCSECPQMVVVPAGTFMMGSPASEEGRFIMSFASDGKTFSDEDPQHSVTIPAPFAVGVYEVTFSEWDACVRGGGCGGYAPPDRGWGRGTRPVINVNWEDAQAYVSWLSQQTGARYRLLSEAEWEYVARAGTAMARYWGESVSAQCRYANGRDSSAPCPDGYEYTAPVGSFAPNVFGLYDVLGNVSEWIQDCRNLGDDYSGAPTDGRAREWEDCLRGLRGGSWIDLPRYLRSADRDWSFPDHRVPSHGFRVARTLN